ncbi:hypothetical protein [Agaribacter flavus]|uniref:Integral membrane protein n=1 Tax=Agaribacter flavus TaxID=1902781 RepID=A0ABV7FP15_9ALTE
MIGPALAVIQISLFYAVVLSELVLQVQKHRLINRALIHGEIRYQTEQNGEQASAFRLLGLFVILLVVMLATSILSNSVMSIPAALFILSIAGIGAFSSYGSACFPLIVGAFKGVKEEQQVIAIYMFLNYLGRLIISAGTIYLLVNLTSMLSTLDDINQLYTRVSESLVGIFSAVVLYLCFIKTLMISLPTNAKRQVEHLSFVLEENKHNAQVLKTYCALAIIVVIATVAVIEGTL